MISCTVEHIVYVHVIDVYLFFIIIACRITYSNMIILFKINKTNVLGTIKLDRYICQKHDDSLMILLNVTDVCCMT
jgi:hypothetical protein